MKVWFPIKLLLQVFKKVRGRVKDGGEMSELELQAVIYNCCHTIKHDSDSSLKSNALEALNNVTLLVEVLAAEKPELARSIVEKVCLNQVGIFSSDSQAFFLQKHTSGAHRYQAQGGLCEVRFHQLPAEPGQALWCCQQQGEGAREALLSRGPRSRLLGEFKACSAA